MEAKTNYTSKNNITSFLKSVAALANKLIVLSFMLCQKMLHCTAILVYLYFDKDGKNNSI